MTKAIKRDITREIVKANPTWFTPKNKAFFQDIAYYGFELSDGQKFMIQKTYGFSDMFGKPKVAHFRLHNIGEDFKVGKMFDDEVFETLLEAKDFMQSR